jgi:hypothetical protein
MHKFLDFHRASAEIGALRAKIKMALTRKIK